MWLHTACQTSFIKKDCIFKISSFFGGYLWIFTVKRGGQPHGSDQCGYIHLLYRLVFCFTVVRVEPLCRLGWWTLHEQNITGLVVELWRAEFGSGQLTRGARYLLNVVTWHSWPCYWEELSRQWTAGAYYHAQMTDLWCLQLAARNLTKPLPHTAWWLL